MRIMDRDYKILERDYPDAHKFIQASELRFEYYILLIDSGNRELNNWEKDRLVELRELHCITDLEFQEYLRDTM